MIQLRLIHLFLDFFSLALLFVHFLDDLHEDTIALLPVGPELSDLRKGDSELGSERHQILGQLHFLVKGNDALRMVDHRDDQSVAVALKNQPLDLLPVTIESKLFDKGVKFDCSVECLRLLEDPDGQRTLDKRHVAVKLRERFDDCLK